MKSNPTNGKVHSPLSTRASVLILTGVTLALLAPFAGKAFHMDDPLFVWAARHIQNDFADPYGFSVNWYGKIQPMWHVMKNPPLTSYYIALAAFVVGWSEWALHLAFLIPAIAASLGTFFLAKEFCSRPLEATLAAILTPVFLISSTTIMCDVMMLAFWVWAIYLWVRGMQTNRHGLLALAMLLVALSALTKYFGIALIPMLAIYSIASKKGWSWVLHLLIPVAILAGYQSVTQSLYGHGLLSDAAQYGKYYQSATGVHTATQLASGLAFTGGCILLALFCAPLLWTRKGLAIGLAVAGLAFIGFSLMPIGGLNPYGAAAVQFALMVSGGIGLLALAVADYIGRRDAGSLMLLLWVAGTFVFASVLNWSVNGRSILPMAPAAGILIIRRIDRLHPKKNLMRYMYLSLTAAMLASLLIGYADHQLAASARKAACQITESYGDSQDIWFEGHWGFQYYMELKGGKAIAFKTFNPATGDLLILPSNNDTYMEPSVPPIDILSFEAPLRLATMHPEVGAGFFAHVRGPLPFAIGDVPPEYYGVFEAP